MRRSTACFAFLLVLGCSLAGAAHAAATPASNLGVDLVSPAGLVSNPFIGSAAVISGADSADTCIQRHLDELAQPRPQLPVACNLVSYVLFWVDLPAHRRHDPEPYGGCPAGPSSCRFMGQDDQAPYSMVERYDGPGGRHMATAQVWRYVWGDSQPVFLGQASERFCLGYCNGR